MVNPSTWTFTAFGVSVDADALEGRHAEVQKPDATAPAKTISLTLKRLSWSRRWNIQNCEIDIGKKFVVLNYEPH